jgi:hypothetical protein
MTSRVIQLRIAMLEVSPRVWRRLRVPEAIALDQLHLIIQVAMGWSDTHLHEFCIHERRYGTRAVLGGTAGGRLFEERGKPLCHALGASRSFDYLYDFGDRWQHLVVVEAIEVLADGVPATAALLDGAGACPPEDVGGAAGYAAFLAAIADPAHPQHAEQLDWAGGAFDPHAFDREAVAAALAALARTPA